jgi:exosortase/archaeosortase family protein
MLWCNQLAISVEPACSGVNGLQSMLVVGSALLFLKLSHSRLYWWNLPLLAGAAWLAHLFRIVTAALCGVWLPTDAAARLVGPIHSLTGWLGLMAGFTVCYAWFSLQAAWLERRQSPLRKHAFAELPWMNLALLVYAGFCARGLVASWRWAPYDRLAWVAFLIWLAPLVCWGRLASPCRKGAWLPWALGACAWMPAAGWLGSRWGISPMNFSIGRMLVAIGAACCGLLRPGRRLSALPERTQPAALLQVAPRHAE